MSKKLTFFEWYDEQERLEGEAPSTEWAEKSAKNTAWKSYRTGEAVHDGDCTNCPYSCSLCWLTDSLIEYRDYFFDKETNE